MIVSGGKDLWKSERKYWKVIAGESVNSINKVHDRLRTRRSVHESQQNEVWSLEDAVDTLPGLRR